MTQSDYSIYAWLPENRIACYVQDQILHHPRFKTVVVAATTIDAVITAIQTYPISPDILLVLGIAKMSLSVFFVVEVVLKMLTHGLKPWRHLQSSWNLFEMALCTLAFTPVRHTSPLRALLLLRVTTLCRHVFELRVLVTSVLKALRSIGYLSMLTVLLFYAYAVVGVELFGANDPAHFSSVHVALLSLFRMATGDDWSDVMYVTIYGCNAYGYNAAPPLLSSSSSGFPPHHAVHGGSGGGSAGGGGNHSFAAAAATVSAAVAAPAATAAASHAAAVATNHTTAVAAAAAALTGWSSDGILSECVAPHARPVVGALYALSFMGLGSIVLFSVIIGVVVRSVSEARAEAVRGTFLEVELLRAENLVAADIWGRSDPYVAAQVSHVRMKTRAILGELNPEWNEGLGFFPLEELGCLLQLTVCDWDLCGRHDFLGSADVDVGMIPYGRWVPLCLPLDGVPHGTLHLRLRKSMGWDGITPTLYGGAEDKMVAHVQELVALWTEMQPLVRESQQQYYSMLRARRYRAAMAGATSFLRSSFRTHGGGGSSGGVGGGAGGRLARRVSIGARRFSARRFSTTRNILFAATRMKGGGQLAPPPPTPPTASASAPRLVAAIADLHLPGQIPPTPCGDCSSSDDSDDDGTNSSEHDGAYVCRNRSDCVGEDKQQGEAANVVVAAE